MDCCKTKPGYYCNYHSKDMVCTESMLWIKQSDFNKMLWKVVNVNYSVKANRDKVLALFNALETDAPFSETVRFPKNACYVQIMCGDWPHKLAKVNAALSLNERIKEKEMKYKLHREGEDDGDARIAYAADDGVSAFFKTISDMFTESCKKDFVFSRRSFESKDGFDLKWCDGKPPGDDDDDETNPPPPPGNRGLFAEVFAAFRAMDLNPEDFYLIEGTPDKLICGKTPLKITEIKPEEEIKFKQIIMFTMAAYQQCSTTNEINVMLYNKETRVLSTSRMVAEAGLIDFEIIDAIREEINGKSSSSQSNEFMNKNNKGKGLSYRDVVRDGVWRVKVPMTHDVRLISKAEFDYSLILKYRKVHKNGRVYFCKIEDYIPLILEDQLFPNFTDREYEFMSNNDAMLLNRKFGDNDDPYPFGWCWLTLFNSESRAFLMMKNVPRICNAIEYVNLMHKFPNLRLKSCQENVFRYDTGNIFHFSDHYTDRGVFKSHQEAGAFSFMANFHLLKISYDLKISSDQYVDLLYNWLLQYYLNRSEDCPKIVEQNLDLNEFVIKVKQLFNV